MPTNEHIHEAKVIRNNDFLQTVEAAMMQVAFEVAREPGDTTGYENRQALAAAIIRNPADRTRFAEMFAWWGIQNQTIRGQVFQPALPQPITPANIDGQTLRQLIRDGWNYAANVTD